MGQVSITLNGRTYRLRCGDGEETRLLALSGHVRTKIEGLAAEFGQVGDDRLMVMAALLITDELFDVRARWSEGQPADPSLFEPLPEARAAGERVSPTGHRATAVPPPPPVTTALPATPPPAPPDPTQPDSSLKRALRRPQAPARQSLDDRLSEARASAPGTEHSDPGRKTGHA